MIHFSTVFHLESVFEADLVSKDRDLCAQESAKSLVITLLEARWKTDVTHNVPCFKTKTLKEQRAKTNTDGQCREILSTKRRGEPRTGGS